MSFLSLIGKNLLRQRVRSALTVVGIGIGITTVVALGVIVEGLKQTSGEIIKIGGADFMVAQKGSADLSFSAVSEDDWAALAAVPGVERASGALFHIVKVGDNPFFVTLGFRPEDVAAHPPTLLAGRTIAAGAANEIMLGDRAAADLGLGVGATVTVGSQAFQVVGVYRSGVLWEDSGAIAALPAVQAMARKPSVVTVVYITTTPGQDAAALAARIEAQFARLATISSVAEYGDVDQGIEIIDALNAAISVLAVGIGAVGVMNTMVMSVFERTREIGILRALGWSGRRILRMIIGEAIVLCLVAAVIGSPIGVLASRTVLLVPIAGTFLEPSYPANIFVRGLVVAVAVALAGAAYPAYRAVRLTPMEALRYE